MAETDQAPEDAVIGSPLKPEDPPNHAPLGALGEASSRARELRSDQCPLSHSVSTKSAVDSQTAVHLRGRWVVLVDEASEHVVTLDVQRRERGDGRAVRTRHAEIDSPVCALFVVVPDVPAKNSFEVTVAQNEHPVQTFCPNRPNPALRVMRWPEGIGPVS